MSAAKPRGVAGGNLGGQAVLREPTDAGWEAFVVEMCREQNLEAFREDADVRSTPWQRFIAREDDPVEGAPRFGVPAAPVE